MSEINQYRRDFLENMGVASLAISSIGLMGSGSPAQARNSDEAVNASSRWGLLVNTEVCKTGCTACVDACNTENGLREINGPLTDASWLRKLDLKNRKTGEIVSLPMMCQHCDSAPCVDVCPTGASFKRADGIVMVDKHICIGCRYCMMACPFKARNFIHETLTDQLPHAPRGKGTVESCTLCVHRLDQGNKSTACVEACPEKAIQLVDIKDQNNLATQQFSDKRSRELRPSLNLNTGVRYQGLEL
jgi:tetrathionate reductase subunit B